MCACFDIQALMALFVLASKDGWVNIMYTGLDAVAIDQQVRGYLVFYVRKSKANTLQIRSVKILWETSSLNLTDLY
jgi:hypothetical protein